MANLEGSPKVDQTSKSLIQPFNHISLNVFLPFVLF